MGLFSDGFKELKKASEPLYKSPKSIQETIERKNFEEAKAQFATLEATVHKA